MMLARLVRSISPSSRSRNVLSCRNGGRSQILTDSSAYKSRYIGLADDNLRITKSYLGSLPANSERNGSGFISKVYELNSVLANPRIRRFFSSEAPKKKNYDNFCRKLKKKNPKGDNKKSESKEKSSTEDNGSHFRILLFYMSIPLLVIGWLVHFGPRAEKQISFQALKNKLLEPGLVDHIVISNESVAKVYVKSSPHTPNQSTDDPIEGNDSPRYKYYINIVSVESFEKRLEKAQEALGIDPHDHVAITYASETPLEHLEVIVLIVLVMLEVALWYMTRIRKRGGLRGMHNIRKPNFDKVDKKVKNKVFFKDVAGCDEAKQEIMEFVHFLKNPKKYEELGARIPKGALLVGPPGTGKTLLAKATAGEFGVPFSQNKRSWSLCTDFIVIKFFLNSGVIGQDFNWSTKRLGEGDKDDICTSGSVWVQ